MRDTATRTVPSAMPNSSPVRTSMRAGRRGGSMPSSVDASTDRAVYGRSSASTASTADGVTPLDPACSPTGTAGGPCAVHKRRRREPHRSDPQPCASRCPTVGVRWTPRPPSPADSRPATCRLSPVPIRRAPQPQSLAGQPGPPAHAGPRAKSSYDSGDSLTGGPAPPRNRACARSRSTRQAAPPPSPGTAPRGRVRH